MTPVIYIPVYEHMTHTAQNCSVFTVIKVDETNQYGNLIGLPIGGHHIQAGETLLHDSSPTVTITCLSHYGTGELKSFLSKHFENILNALPDDPYIPPQV